MVLQLEIQVVLDSFDWIGNVRFLEIGQSVRKRKCLQHLFSSHLYFLLYFVVVRFLKNVWMSVLHQDFWSLLRIVGIVTNQVHVIKIQSIFRIITLWEFMILILWFWKQLPHYPQINLAPVTLSIRVEWHVARVANQLLEFLCFILLFKHELCQLTTRILTNTRHELREKVRK
jgi:hypothetical protein